MSLCLPHPVTVVHGSGPMGGSVSPGCGEVLLPRSGQYISLLYFLTEEAVFPSVWYCFLIVAHI